MERPIIAVWFSCGAASAMAAKLTVEKYGETHDVRIVNNPVAEENIDNRRFADDVSNWIDRPIESASNPKYPDNSAVTVWDERKYMSGIHGAPCTVHLKKHSRQLWELDNKPDHHVLGFTSEEKDRHERFILTERSNVIPVLIGERMSKAEAFMRITEAGIELPQSYRDGFPNANCDGCVKATSATYWNHVRVTRPEVFEARAEQSRRLGTKLVRVDGKRIYLDELKPADTGRPMKDLSFECGIFCEERP